MVDQYETGMTQRAGILGAKTVEECTPPRGDGLRANPQVLLDMAKEIEMFVCVRGWSWCDMDRVYRVLKGIHG